MTTIIEGIKKILNQYGSLIERYRGDIPASVVAARIWHETRGNPCPPPTACCDERGLLQLWPATRAKYGVTDACDPAQAIYAGCAHWNAESQSLRDWLIANGYAVPVGEEFWALAYLNTAIGAGATHALVKAAGTAAFSSVATFVADAAASGALATLSSSFGSQSPKVIETRIKNTAAYVGAAYEIGGGGGLLLLGLVAFTFWWFYRRR